jgi:uncharacterized DUF497 family protein
VTFTWDVRKAAANLEKHGVDFREAATVFDDTLSTTFPDHDHSSSEPRFLTIGMSAVGRVLVVSHAEAGNHIRLISARETTRRERRFYEESE